MEQVGFGRTRAVRYAVALAIVMLGTIPYLGTMTPAAAQSTATIEIQNIDAGTGLPAPFTRFQATSENGTVYGPLETDLNGYVAFSVTVDPQGTRFTVEEETPPACAPAPDAQTTGPLAPGDTATLNFSTRDEPDCGLGTIALYAMACPEGFAAPADDYAPWRDGCTGTNDGTQFKITSVATGQSWSPMAGAYGIPGRAPIVGLPAGDYTFQQDDGTPAAAFCLIYDTANYATSPAPASVAPIRLENGVGTVTLTGNRVSCDLFAVPGGAVAQPSVPVEAVSTDTGSLDVHMLNCPGGFPDSGSIYDECHGNGLPSVAVQLSTATAVIGTVQTAVPESPGPGIASFADLTPGGYRVGAAVGTGTTVYTYCSDENDQFVPSSFDSANSLLSLQIGSGQSVTCDWYVEQASSGSSSIEVHTLLCPPGTDPSGALYDECHGYGIAGVTVQIRTDGGLAGDGETVVLSDPGPGVIAFDELKAGSYSLTAGNPGTIAGGGSAVAVIYCSLADADDRVPVTMADGWVAYLQLPGATDVVCDWYVVPSLSELATTLQVTSYRCPANMIADASWTRDDFLEVCAPSAGTTQFTLTPPNGQPVTLTTGSAGVGTVMFEGLPSGDVQLVSSIPGHDNTSFVYCGVEGGDLSPVGDGGSRIDIALDAALGTWVCQWFNDGENLSGFSDTLTATSLLCPPGTPENDADRCAAAPLSGGTFRLERDGWGMLGSPAENGADMVFGNLTPGSYRLTYSPPSSANVALYVARCEGNGQRLDIDYDDVNGMSIAFDLPGGIDVACRWYNIPPGLPTATPNRLTGSITVHKFLCQGKSIASYNWETDCTVQHDPAGFSLRSANGSPIAAGSTGTNGLLTYTQLANGAYRLDETTGNWCHAEADRVDSAGNVLVAGGGNTDVFIYNCSVRQVGRLPSTGTGPAGASGGPAFERAMIWHLVLAAGGTLGLALIARYQLQQAAGDARRSEASGNSVEQLEEPL